MYWYVCAGKVVSTASTELKTVPLLDHYSKDTVRFIVGAEGLTSYELAYLGQTIKNGKGSDPCRTQTRGGS